MCNLNGWQRLEIIWKDAHDFCFFVDAIESLDLSDRDHGRVSGPEGEESRKGNLRENPQTASQEVDRVDE